MIAASRRLSFLFLFTVFLLCHVLAVVQAAPEPARVTKTVTKYRTKTITIPGATQTVQKNKCKRSAISATTPAAAAVVGEAAEAAHEDDRRKGFGVEKRAKARTKTVYQTRTVTKQRAAKTITQTVCNATPTTTTAAPVSTDGFPSYNRAFATNQVAYHNQKRALHQSTPPLVWNDTLAQFAMDYAKACPVGHSGHGYGENLAWGWPQDQWTDQQLFQLWYDEGDNYDYSKNEFSEDDGHFTQLVWKSSTSVGCSLVSCPKQYYGTSDDYRMLTCEYWPPGNYAGQYTANVMPLK